MDGVLQVVSPDGFVLDQNNDWHGLDPQVAFTAPKDGTYLVRLFAFPAIAGLRASASPGGETFVYRLTLTTGGFADFPIPLAVERKAGATVEVTGWNVPAEARRLPVPLDGDVATVFHPRLANPLQVRLESHPCWDATKPAGPLRRPVLGDRPAGEAEGGQHLPGRRRRRGNRSPSASSRRRSGCRSAR